MFVSDLFLDTIGPKKKTKSYSSTSFPGMIIKANKKKPYISDCLACYYTFSYLNFSSLNVKCLGPVVSFNMIYVRIVCNVNTIEMCL